jgi:hypothetical protein
MPQIVHVVLSKIAPGVPDSFTDEWIKRGNAMQGALSDADSVETTQSDGLRSILWPFAS